MMWLYCNQIDVMACVLTNLVTLWLARNVGPVRIGRIIADNNLDKVVSQPDFYAKRYRLTARSIQDISSPNQQRLQQHLAFNDAPNQHLITSLDAAYPPLLLHIYDPPPILFVKGDVSLLSSAQIAVVGARQMSYYGQDATTDIVTGLVHAGLTITSGLAYGVDKKAHQVAMQASGKTIAVLGTGINQTYPASHEALASQILEQDGALVSEFPLDTGSHRAHFPKRNRIVTGLSYGVLVIEAKCKSGSLISARLAMEQGRDVFAVPGSINSALSRGPHALISQGAKLVETARDILNELPIEISILKKNAKKNLQSATNDDKKNILDTEVSHLLQCIGSDQTPIDIIIERSQQTASAVLSSLAALEIEGLITKVPGGYIRRRYR